MRWVDNHCHLGEDAPETLDAARSLSLIHI